MRDASNVIAKLCALAIIEGSMAQDSMENILSFRSHLTSGISDFAAFLEWQTKDVEWLTELIVILANYQEEGLQLYPVVFIAKRLELILSKLDGKVSITVGSGPNTNHTVRRAFKQCAPLAEDREWSLFIEIRDDELVYGVFRIDQSPLKPTAFERLRQIKNPAVKVIGLTRLGGSFVELRAASERHLYVDLSGSVGESYNPPRLLRAFTDVISRQAPAAVRTLLRGFYYQVLVDLLHAKHGALIAVIPKGSKIYSGFLSDGVFLNPEIRVCKGISEYIESDAPEHHMQSLRSWKQLLRKMSSMDGITILDSSGSIIGYNCFISGSPLEPRALESLNGIRLGGARKRAFDLLCSYLGQGFEGVFYRSQDGSAEFETTP